MTVKARKELISDIVIYVLRAAELIFYGCTNETDIQEIKASCYDLIFDRITAEIKKGGHEFDI